MCGIIISDLTIPNDFKFIQNRGPDATNSVQYNGINFVHFLLHLTGEKTIQPIINDNVVCIFNGEIYNYKQLNANSKSDCYSILHAYNTYGEEFVKYLDGEFTIILFDFNKNKIYICSDIFKTKPLFYNLDNNIVISSYESMCKKIHNQNYYSIQPNEVLVFDLQTKILLKKYPVVEFNLTQTKDYYNDFNNALENAILKRFPEKTIPLITLSSGHDSGAIVCCLHKHNKDFLAVTINKNENDIILQKRKNILHDKLHLINLEDWEKNNWKQHLQDNCEPFYWDWTYHPKMRTHVPNGFTMGSMLGKSKILDYTKTVNPSVNILYSGIGADEVMAFNSFYSRGYGNVDYFQNDLSKQFPWPNFFNGSMENYLKGDEYVGGCFSFETRYPFCDKDLVQEFLSLKPELKNVFNGTNYKPPLTQYLEKEGFPYHVDKLGFNV